MFKTNRRQSGLSIVELLLVLVIGAGVLYLSLRQYQVFRQDADVQQVEANVDTLFQAMVQYHKANCYGSSSPTVTATLSIPGTLNPANSTSPLPGPYHIDIDNDLVAGGYLPANIPFPESPIVDNTGGGSSRFKGYVVQFNATSTQRTTNGVVVGTVLIWRPQVAVLIKDTAVAKQYMNQMKGDCLSTLNGNIVKKCASGSTGTYVVFERSPSFATVKSNSTLWQAKSVLNQFTQMYTVYPTPYLLNKQGVTPTNQLQYYLCGG